MKNIEIILTNSCNLKCIFCRSPLEKVRIEINLEQCKKILLWGRKANIEGVYFGGGEPTIVENLTELVALAKNLNYKTIRIISNGIVLENVNYLKKLINAGANEFEIPIWGVKDVHNKLSGTNNNFEKAESTIKHLVKLNVLVEINYLLTTLSYKDTEKIIKYFASLGVKNFLLFVFSLFSLSENLEYLLPKYTDIMKYLSLLFKELKNKNIDIRTSHIPLCFLREHKKYFFDIKKLDLLIISKTGKFKCEDSPFEGGVKVATCNECVYFVDCLGLREDYLKKYGHKEIKPILK